MIEGLQNFQNVFKIPELKRRVLITLGLLAAYRLGAHVPTPGIDGAALAEFFNQMQGTLLGMVDAAMPAALWKKRRRLRPCLPPSSSAMASSRASTSRCRSFCGSG